MYKKVIWILAITGSLILSQTVAAHSGGCGKGLKTMLESLKLDDAQKEKIKPIFVQLKTSISENEGSMNDLDTKINQQVDSASMDQTTVDSLIDQKAKLIGNMIKAKMIAKNKILGILDAHQKTQLQGMMTKMEDKIAEKFKNCHNDD